MLIVFILLHQKGIIHIHNYLDKSYKEKCPEENASWYIANKKCKVQDSQLRSYTLSRFLSLCFRREETFWIGNHVAERIVWANGILFIYVPLFFKHNIMAVS